MILIFLFMCISLIATINVSWKGLNKQYLSKENTQVIKGIFIIFVFLSHIRTYANFNHSSDIFVISILDYLGQLMVTLFLFYSGYGVFESIKKKGEQYISSFPSNRIGKTFFDFAISIVLFLIVDAVVGQFYPKRIILLSFTGWKSVGNSNWYMFAIFTLYILTYICFRIVKNKYKLSLCLMSLCALVYVIVISQIQPTRFSNTYLCYVAGMWYSYYKTSIDHFFEKNMYLYYIVTALIVAGYCAMYSIKGLNIYSYNLTSILFCLSIVLISLKISFHSRVIEWFGIHLFWVYILQRLPMILFDHFGLVNKPYVFLILTFFITLIISKYMQLWSIKMKKLIWRH